jgi:hypothetical protein
VIIPVVFTGVKHGLEMCEGSVLKKTSGPAREEATGGWIELFNEESCTLCQILPGRPNQEDEIGGACNSRGSSNNDTQNFSRKT